MAAKRGRKGALRFDFEFMGLEQRANALTHPDAIMSPLKEFLQQATNIGQRAAVETVEPVGVKQPVGNSVRTILTQVKPAEGRVYTVLPKARAISIERGRKPGEHIPLAQIIRWQQAAHLTTPAILIKLDIKRRGTKGKYFMRAARERVEANLPVLKSLMGNKIVRRLAE